MKTLLRILAVMVLGVTLSAAQTADRATASNDNRATSANQYDNSAPRDHNWGWIGLLGLAGLGGLRGRRRESEYTSTRDRNVSGIGRAA